MTGDVIFEKSTFSFPYKTGPQIKDKINTNLAKVGIVNAPVKLFGVGSYLSFSFIQPADVLIILLHVLVVKTCFNTKSPSSQHVKRGMIGNLLDNASSIN